MLHTRNRQRLKSRGTQLKHPHVTGFTVVELVIAIVIIAILASIATLGFQNVQARTKNATRYQEVKEWRRIFTLYASKHGGYPASAPLAKYCLGTGFPLGTNNQPRCQNYKDTNIYVPPGAPGENYDGINILESYNTTLLNELRTVSSKLPTDSPQAIGAIAGPWIWYRGTGEQPRIYTNFHKSAMPTCPTDMQLSYDGSEGIVCYLDLP